MVEWDTVVVSSIISAIVAIGVALCVRYKVKPKHEVVFEHNRNVEFKRIFDTIHFLDFHFQNFLDDLEKEMGPLTNDRETLTPKPEFKPLPEGGQIAEFSLEQTKLALKFQRLLPKLKFNFEQIRKITQGFQNDYLRLLNQIENSFLTNVWNYIFSTHHYAEWAQKDFLMSSLLKENMKTAKKIIDFLESDKTIDLTEPYIKEFIEKWKLKFTKYNI